MRNRLLRHGSQPEGHEAEFYAAWGGLKIGGCKLAVRAFKCRAQKHFWRSPRQYLRANLQQPGGAYVRQ
jgi:hypothetical protein